MTQVLIPEGRSSGGWNSRQSAPRINMETNQILPGGIPLRIWHIYIHIWLGCLAFPIASLLQLHPTLNRLIVAVAGLAVFAIFYVWTMRQHPIEASAESGRRASLVLFSILLVTLLGLILSVAFDAAFLWLFVGASIIAGRTLALRSAHLVATVLPLLAVGTGVALGGGIVGADWLHILPLALLIRALGLNMIGLSLQFATIRDLHLAREELARKAVNEERLRLARDLHDLLGHTLSLIVLKSELTGRLIEKDPARAAHEIRELETVARQALREVRQAVAGYRQPTLQGELDGARQMLTAAGIACSVEEKAMSVSPATDTVLAWIVREGVTNVIRHSKATRCIIRIACDDTDIHIEVINDGSSRDADVTNESGSGLPGLNERILAQGGRIQAGPFATEDIQGFRLLVEIPLAGKAVEEKQSL